MVACSVSLKVEATSAQSGRVRESRHTPVALRLSFAPPKSVRFPTFVAGFFKSVLANLGAKLSSPLRVAWDT